jgi:hypothetical protein
MREIGLAEVKRLQRLFAWSEGESSPAWWGDVVGLQRGRVGQDLRDYIAEGRTEGDSFDRLRSNIYMLFMAIRHVFRYAERFDELSDDPRIDRARQKFLRKAPEAKNLRDFLEHLDEYAIGEGRMQRQERMDPRHKKLMFALGDQIQEEDEVFVVLGNDFVPVKTAAHAAMELADRLTEVQQDEMRAFRNALPALSDEEMADLRQEGDLPPIHEGEAWPG